MQYVIEALSPHTHGKDLFLTGVSHISPSHKPEFMDEPVLTEMNALTDYQMLLIRLSTDPKYFTDPRNLHNLLGWVDFISDRGTETTVETSKDTGTIDIQAQREFLTSHLGAHMRIQGHLDQQGETVTMIQTYRNGYDIAHRALELKRRGGHVQEVRERKEIFFNSQRLKNKNSYQYRYTEMDATRTRMRASYVYTPSFEGDENSPIAQIELRDHTIVTAHVELINTEATADLIRTVLPPSDPSHYFATMYRK